MESVPAPLLTVCFPAYNEAEQLREKFARLRSVLADCDVPHEVVLVNDGSADGTAAIADELAVAHPELRVVHHEANRGLSGALRSARDAARGEWLLLVPVDSVPSPALLRDYLAAREGVDTVVGYRPDRVGYPAWARLGSRVMHAMVSTLFGLRLRDYNWICLYRVERLRRIDWHERSIAFLPEILVGLNALGCRFAEIPSPMEERRTGKATVFRPATAVRAFAGLLRVSGRAAGPAGRLLAVAFLAAVALRFAALERHDLWVDEAISVLCATGADLRESVSRQISELPFWPAVLWSWFRLGSSHAWFRALPAAFGGLSLWLLWRLARRRWGAEAGVATLLFGGSSAFLVYYAQEGRCYSLFLFLALVSLAAFWRLVERGWGAWGGPAAYAAAHILGLYTHYFAFPFLGASFLGGLAYPELRARWGRWLLLHAAIVVAFLPWIPSTRHSLQVAGRYDRFSASADAGKDLAVPAVVFAVGKTLIPTSGRPHFALEAVLLGGGLLAAAGLGALGLRRLVRERRGADLVLGATVLLLPLLFAVGATRAGLPLYNFTRVKYLIFAYPFFVWLLALGWAETRGMGRRTAAWVLALVLIGANGRSLANYFGDPEYLRAPAYRDSLATIAARRAPDEPLVCTSQWTYLPVVMTARLEGIDLPVYSLVGGGSADATNRDPIERWFDHPRDLPVAPGQRVWRLVYCEWRTRAAHDAVSRAEGPGWRESGYRVEEGKGWDDLGLRIAVLRRER